MVDDYYCMSDRSRAVERDEVENTIFDVVIVGAGINGACLYHHLCRRGYRILLIDKGDFASGTSQASAMLIWGGLLYLRQMDVSTVWKLSRARDAMVRELGAEVEPRTFRYVPRTGGAARFGLLSGLWLYWFLGAMRRRPPVLEMNYPEKSLLAPQARRPALSYEEAALSLSDSRFVLRWILPWHGEGKLALNHCGLSGAAWDPSRREWRIDLHDNLEGRELSTRARWIVNCAGIWTDEVNAIAGIDCAYKHLLSKGVFVTVRRPRGHESPLMFDTGVNGDSISFLPWGPVSLWGPTETFVERPQRAYAVESEDVRWLLDQSARHLESRIRPADVVSLRCGVRPLAVKKSFAGRPYPLELSRRSRVSPDQNLPWVSVHGGKITGCIDLAEGIVRLLPHFRSTSSTLPRPLEPIEWSRFPGLSERVPSARWCRKEERCYRLVDYLRRRTNISQWVRGGGLGDEDRNLSFLVRIASVFTGGDIGEARRQVEKYRDEVRVQDDLIAFADPYREESLT